MLAFRLARKKYGLTLNGKGAALSGGRWNSKGTEMVYLAGNRSLAMAEVAVHMSFAMLPKDYCMLEVLIPEKMKPEIVPAAELPSNWNVFPPVVGTQRIGDEFVRKSSRLCLQVPSAVTRGDFNLLVNPNHLDFPTIKIISVEDFPFDRRLFNA